MVCGRVIYRSWAQMVFFVGYMIGSIVFGVLADKYDNVARRAFATSSARLVQDTAVDRSWASASFS
jgi:MFS family permease